MNDCQINESQKLFVIRGDCNAGISGHPEGATPGHPGAFVTAAATNSC